MTTIKSIVKVGIIAGILSCGLASFAADAYPIYGGVYVGGWGFPYAHVYFHGPYGPYWHHSGYYPYHANYNYHYHYVYNYNYNGQHYHYVYNYHYHYHYRW